MKQLLKISGIIFLLLSVPLEAMQSQEGAKLSANKKTLKDLHDQIVDENELIAASHKRIIAFLIVQEDFLKTINHFDMNQYLERQGSKKIDLLMHSVKCAILETVQEEQRYQNKVLNIKKINLRPQHRQAPLGTIFEKNNENS